MPKVSSSLFLTIVGALLGCGLAADKGPYSSSSTFERLEGTPYSIPASSEAHYRFMLAELNLSREDYEGALQNYEEVLSLEEESSPWLRRRVAELYVRKGKLDKALEQLRVAAPSYADDAEFLQLYAGVLSGLGKLDEAASLYRKLIELSSGQAEYPYLLLSSIYDKQAKFEEAKAVLTDCIGNIPNSFYAYYYLARIAEGLGDMKLAVDSYQRAMTINPRQESLKLDYAKLLGRSGRLEEAKLIVQEVLTKNPTNLTAREIMGQLLVQADKVPEAIEEYEALSILEEDASDTRFKIALLKLNQGDINGAITELNLVVAAEPDNAPARFHLASAYAAVRELESAIKQLRLISKDSQVYFRAKTTEAMILREMKRYPESEKALRALLELGEKEVGVLALLASVQSDAGNKKGAIQTIKDIIELDPKRDSHYFSLGVLYDEVGEKKNSIKAMEEAIELNGENATALNYLGYTLAEKGIRLEEAQAMIERALKLEPNNGYYLDSLGWVFFKKGQYPKALEILQKAVAIVPQDAVILEHLALALEKVGKKEEALEVYRKAVDFSDDSEDKQVGHRVQSRIEALEEELSDKL